MASTRKQFTAAEKKKLCEISRDHPSWKQKQVIEAAAKALDLPEDSLKRGTVGDILKQKDKWLNISDADNKAVRQREAQWPRLEECLRQWFGQVTALERTARIV